MVTIRRVERPDPSLMPALSDLLIDSVRGGASVGFLWPLHEQEASAYWRGVFGALDDDLSLFVAEDAGHVAGSVQLARCARANGRHRAEVQKLFVHSSSRGRGIASQLLRAVDDHARAIGCTLLVLDTEAESLAESVYRKHGWRKAGEIPNYAGKPSGELIPTAYYYKWLPGAASFALVRPGREHLPSYLAALRAGWSWDNVNGAKTLERELGEIEAHPERFLELQVDREARGGPVTLLDGSQAPRLPGYKLWMWDGEFCGSINFRWQPGTGALPAHVLGHIGYGVVPWKRHRGYATQALALMLERAREERLPYVEITCDPTNVASQRTIVANGGVLVERFMALPGNGGGEKLRYRIALAPS
jgi:predicted acetyltransferase